MKNSLCPREESNFHLALRTGLLYSLSYEGTKSLSCIARNHNFDKTAIEGLSYKQ